MVLKGLDQGLGVECEGAILSETRADQRPIIPVILRLESISYSPHRTGRVARRGGVWKFVLPPPVQLRVYFHRRN